MSTGVISGGGWVISPLNQFTGSAVCYAGEGSTYLPLPVSDPFQLLSPSQLQQLAGPGGCQHGRVSDIDDFVPSDFFRCSVPSQGGAMYCEDSVNQSDLLCGTGAILVLSTTKDGGGPRIQIEQKAIEASSGLMLPDSSRVISHVISDAPDCFQQGDTVTCQPGWTHILLFPSNYECVLMYDACDINCPTVSGLNKIGKCSGTVATSGNDACVAAKESNGEENPPFSPPTRAPAKTPAQPPTDTDSTSSAASTVTIFGVGVVATALLGLVLY